jgi:hypothetical protein
MALVLDWLTLVALVSGVAIAWTGGDVSTVAGVRVSARDPWRPLVAGLVLGVVRLIVARRAPWLGRSREHWRRVRARLYRPTLDEPAVAVPAARAHALAAIGIAAAGVFLLWPQMRQMSGVPDLGDPLFSMWRMGWVLHQLQGDPRPLFNTNIFYPEPLTFTYSDSMLLPALTAAPLLASGMAPAVAYNVLFLSAFFFSGVAAYALVFRLTRSAAAAFVSGLVFGFYPYRFEHYSHLELQMAMWAPLMLLALHRFLQTARWRDALAAGACLVAQLYSSMYYAVFLTMFGGVVAAVLAAIRRPSWRTLVGPVAVTGALALAAAIPLIRPYSASTPLKGERGPEEVGYYSAVPTDYLRPNFRSAVWADTLLQGRQPERALFPGAAPLVLAAAALVPPVGPIRLAYLAAAVVAFDGSLGFHGLIWRPLYHHSSVIRGLRAPARFSVFVGLGLAVLAGFGVRRLLRALPAGRARAAGLAVLAALTVADARPILKLRTLWPAPPPIYGTVEGRRDVVLAEFPLTRDYGDNTPYLYFSLWHWAPMVNGYSGFVPASYQALAEAVASFPSDEAFAALRARGVTHVSVNCGLYRGGCEELLATLDQRRDLRVVAEGRWQGQPVRLYTLER